MRVSDDVHKLSLSNIVLFCGRCQSNHLSVRVNKARECYRGIHYALLCINKY